MKKLIFTTLAVPALTVSTFAQGTVSWGSPGSAIIVTTNGTVASSFVGGGGLIGFGSTGVTLGNTALNDAALGYNGYFFELLVSSSASSAPTTFLQLSAWSDANLQATNGATSNGRIITTSTGGAGGVAGNTQATASNWAAGMTESVILVGWSANLGTTWSQALANAQNGSYLYGLSSLAYFGVSTLGELAPNSGNPGVTVFGSNAGQINNPSGNPMVLEPLITTPEPGTLGLAATGGASLLLFRRKK